MLRNIQAAAAGIAAIFAFGAFFDFAVKAQGTIGLMHSPWPGTDLAQFIPTWLWFDAAIGLACVPWLAMLSVRASRKAKQANDHVSLEYWRRITWATSISQTTGCLFFVLDGSLLFLPAAIALLIVGVAELACILQDLEAVQITPSRRVVT